MPSYADEMTARLPATLPLPDEFRALFDWMEQKASSWAASAFQATVSGSSGPRTNSRAVP